MLKCYIIMGEAGVKKSSTIRALTGAFKRKVYDVAVKDAEPIKIFVQIRSLQEIPKKGVNPNNFIKEINLLECDYVLLSLRINRCNDYCPPGYDYIRKFINNGWGIESVIILNEKKIPLGYPNGAPQPKLIRDTIDVPANEIANIIRNYWKWL